MFRKIIQILILTLPLQGHAQLPLELNEFLSSFESRRMNLPSNKRIFNHYYTSRSQSKTAVIFVPGMGEPAIKYYEFALDLKKLDVQVYMWDHIGQGFSTHLLPNETEKVHIDKFENHVIALENLLKQIRKNHNKIYVVGHSMGGHVSLRVAYRNPELIDKLVMTAPMLDLHGSLSLLHYVNQALNWLPGSFYPPLTFLFTRQSQNISYLTHSIKRTETYKTIKQRFPKIQRKAVTVGWLRSAIESIKELKSQISQDLKSHILLLEADEEYVVSKKAQNEFCNNKKYCRRVLLNGSRHEILYETDDIRSKALEEIKKFLLSTL